MVVKVVSFEESFCKLFDVVSKNWLFFFQEAALSSDKVLVQDAADFLVETVIIKIVSDVFFMLFFLFWENSASMHFAGLTFIGLFYFHSSYLSLQPVHNRTKHNNSKTG